MTDGVSPITTDVDYEWDGKQTSYLRVPHVRNDSAWGSVLIPIVVIKNGDGPTVYFNGGMHGGEYEGPVCLTKLAKELKPEAISGRVIIIPALNIPAVMSGTRLSPIDNKDMNRVFPGRWNGTISEIIAQYVFTEILPKCDAVIDIHSGGYSLDLSPYISMHYLDDDNQRSRTFNVLKAFNAPYALIMNEFSGAGLLDYAVENMGLIFLCAELGGGGRLSVNTLNIAEIGTRNVLKHFGILPGDMEPAPQKTTYLEIPDTENYHIALSSGIYEPHFEPNETIAQGEVLGKVHFLDRVDRPPEPITAQKSGTLIGIRAPGHVERGDSVAVIASPINDLKQLIASGEDSK
ncbi:MAG: succinylglutamate desuccinylase/aspartoacylase family protein [Aggregatilineales bacterium]